ncbi:MAG: nucleotidyltransferase family protein [Spirochaetes bacterium]|nr:nucleotidyltransferase family protein [Spirochaetota bacterium]
MKTAMILCAGYGTRMKEFTRDVPKPMLPIAGRPMLEYTIRSLAAQGVTRAVINLHYLPEAITSYFKDGRELGIEIVYSYETEPLGTAGAVKNAEHILKNEDDFLVLYGDVFCTQDYRSLYSFHAGRKNATATIIMHERERSNSIVEVDESGMVETFIERPSSEPAERRQKWVNSGLYCFKRKILDYIEKVAFFDFPKDIFPYLIRKSELYGFALQGYRCSVDSPERYTQLQKDFDDLHILDSFLRMT